MKTLSELKEQLTDDKVKEMISCHNDSAYINSTVALEGIEFEDKEDEANYFDEVIERAEFILNDYDFIEIEDQGNLYRAIWHKK